MLEHFSGPLLLTPKAINQIAKAGAHANSNPGIKDRLWRGLAAQNRREGMPKKQGVGYVPITGMIDQKRSWMMDYLGGTSTEEVEAVLDKLLRDGVKTIVLDFDSPGGTVRGVQELSDKIYQARSSARIISLSNSEMDSAAYYIGSSAAEVYATPGSSTGSIGVWSMATEVSEQLAADGVKVLVTRSQASPYKAEFLGV